LSKASERERERTVLEKKGKDKRLARESANERVERVCAWFVVAVDGDKKSSS
jgi:hypothetical protein